MHWVRRRLTRWGRVHFRNFAWREESDPWLTLVAEFLLQRTRARQAERAFIELREHYSTAASLAAGGPEASRRILGSLGLLWRAQNLHALASEVAQRGGHPPETIGELRSLPGIGDYTASAWLSLFRHRRAAVVDSNVARWLSRLTGLSRPSDPRHCRWLKDLAETLTPVRSFRAYNYAVIDFTMTICTPTHPACESCVLRMKCHYFSHAFDKHRPSAA